MVISYSSTFEYFSSSSPLMHKCKGRKKSLGEKPSLMTIELSLVVKNIRTFLRTVREPSEFGRALAQIFHFILLCIQSPF